MIKDDEHAREVCQRRKQAGKRGIPAAVKRWLWRTRDSRNPVAYSARVVKETLAFCEPL